VLPSDGGPKAGPIERTGVPLRIKLRPGQPRPTSTSGTQWCSTRPPTARPGSSGDFHDRRLHQSATHRGATTPATTHARADSGQRQTYYKQASLVLAQQTRDSYNSEWSLPLGSMGMLARGQVHRGA
jgi:tyrosyl-tRNA synthetase